MGGFSGFSVRLPLVCVVALLSSVHCQDTRCRVQDGKAGDAGSPGRDGWQGSKGEKGEPVVQLNAGLSPGFKGMMGSRGLPGEMGPKGYSGDLGPAGPAGIQGPAGPSGVHRDPSQNLNSAFSVSRTDRSYPPYNRKLTFNKAITNIASHFSLPTGTFTCKVAGIYYFVFHSMSKVTMCLSIHSEVLGDRKLGFCDYNKRGTTQVLSGGAVLKLAENQKVWLESFRDNQPGDVLRDDKDKEILFNGFLLFST